MTPAPDRIADAFRAASQRGGSALVTYVMAGDPDLATSRDMALACAAGLRLEAVWPTRSHYFALELAPAEDGHACAANAPPPQAQAQAAGV